MVQDLRHSENIQPLLADKTLLSIKEIVASPAESIFRLRSADRFSATLAPFGLIETVTKTFSVIKQDLI